jgi:hypothetical protein
MKKMASSSVFLSGLDGLGVETAKSVALAGVKRLTLHDTKLATWVLLLKESLEATFIFTVLLYFLLLLLFVSISSYT